MLSTVPLVSPGKFTRKASSWRKHLHSHPHYYTAGTTPNPTQSFQSSVVTASSTPNSSSAAWWLVRSAAYRRLGLVRWSAEAGAAMAVCVVDYAGRSILAVAAVWSRMGGLAPWLRATVEASSHFLCTVVTLWVDLIIDYTGLFKNRVRVAIVTYILMKSWSVLIICWHC